MGVVYLARDVRRDRPVALKGPPEHLTQCTNLRERLLPAQPQPGSLSIVPNL
jgi:hypothetical protein